MTSLTATPAAPKALRRPLIRLCDVVHIYPTAAGPFTSLKGINLEVHPGEFLGIVGRSGAGKSTLVNVITGVDRPAAGEVWIGDVAVHTLNEDQMSLWRGRNVGVIYQSFELLPTLSLLDNVTLPMDLCGLYHPRRSPQRARQLLAGVGLEEHILKPPTKISGGQQQRVAIARALANDPPLIVADEPTGNLDSQTADQVLHLFAELNAQGKTIIMVTHDESLCNRFSRVVRIADGEITEA